MDTCHYPISLFKFISPVSCTRISRHHSRKLFLICLWLDFSFFSPLQLSRTVSFLYMCKCYYMGPALPAFNGRAFSTAVLAMALCYRECVLHTSMEFSAFVIGWLVTAHFHFIALSVLAFAVFCRGGRKILVSIFLSATYVYLPKLMHCRALMPGRSVSYQTHSVTDQHCCVVHCCKLCLTIIWFFFSAPSPNSNGSLQEKQDPQFFLRAVANNSTYEGSDLLFLVGKTLSDSSVQHLYRLSLTSRILLLVIRNTLELLSPDELVLCAHSGILLTITCLSQVA